jgi:hypothetical protein
MAVGFGVALSMLPYMVKDKVNMPLENDANLLNHLVLTAALRN